MKTVDSKAIRKSYELRRKNLKRLGFSTYWDYLASPLWQTIRVKILKFYKYKCAGCNKKATCVHHRSYSYPTMTGKNQRNLIPLCSSCHFMVEFGVDGNKLTHKQSMIKTDQRIRPLVAPGKCMICRFRDSEPEKIACSVCRMFHLGIKDAEKYVNTIVARKRSQTIKQSWDDRSKLPMCGEAEQNIGSRPVRLKFAD